MPRAKKSIKRDRDFQGSVLRFGAVFGLTFGTLLAAMQADAHDAFGPNTAMYVYPVALILGPLVGYFTGIFLDGAVLKLFAGAFGREGGRTGPQHSPGETLLQKAEYAEAAEWFANQYRTDPKDWRAQARLVEILTEHFDDDEHLAGEKNRLLKADGVPEGLWCRIVLELASYREATNRQKQAITLYRILVERYTDSWEAGEARERLRALEAGGFLTGS